MIGVLIPLLAAVLVGARSSAQLPLGAAVDRPLGIPWREVVAVPQIETWSLNPLGDAAIIRTATIEPATDRTSYDLHLLAINAQFTVPAVRYGSAHPSALYTFVSDDTFITLQPAESGWIVLTQTIKYTVIPPAVPPSASAPMTLTRLDLSSPPVAIVYASDVKVLSIVLDKGAMEGSLLLLQLRNEGSTWGLEASTWPLTGSDMIIEEVVSSGDKLAFVAYSGKIRPWNSTRSLLYTLDLDSTSLPVQVSLGSGGSVTSPSFSTDGKLAWLEQRDDGNARGQRKLWIADAECAWEVETEDYDLSPHAVVWSKNGEALNLLTLQDQEQAYYHLWTPKNSTSPIRPTRIPSHGTTHEGEHVGITPLNHSHFIAVKSSLTSARELWVISHSPFEDPTENFEEIRLTHFTEIALSNRDLRAGERFAFVNNLNRTIQGRIFLPQVVENAPVIFYLHGDEEGGGWHDWWMPYWNPNAFIAEGYAVIAINPTGAEGYSDSFTQARRFQWGNQTLLDLHQGLLYCLNEYPLDSGRMFAMGYGAYGGFAVHWIQGNNEHWGFTGFVSHNGILSPRWWAVESAEPFKANWEFGPLSYASDSPYTLWDPEQFVDRWSTPELLIADGDNDADVGPDSQSIAAFAALRSRDITTVLLQSTSVVEWQRAIFDFIESL